MRTGLKDNVADFRLCVRTITLDPVSQFLYWRMNWHLEHHMFAAVPCYNLKRLHGVVAADMPRPRTVVGAWREMRQTWKRQQVDPTYQFETPLPGSQGERENAGCAGVLAGGPGSQGAGVAVSLWYVECTVCHPGPAFAVRVG